MTDILEGTTPQYQAMQCNDLPTSCVNYGVVDTLTGKEVCRVWDEGDCRTIADLLNEPPRPEQPALDLARKAASADKLVDVAQKLADAERGYRLCHDIKGDGHAETGRAWDYMRKCGDRMRQALAEYEGQL